MTTAAVRLPTPTEWHRRLHYCGMSLLLGPAFGRLLPMPLLQPWSWETAFGFSLLFPIAGMVADIRRSGRVHPAWHWGMATMVGCLVLTEAITYSPAGTALYAAVTRGSPGAEIAPLDFAAPPAGALMTGRK
jgi:hypothetical protein